MQQYIRSLKEKTRMILSMTFRMKNGCCLPFMTIGGRVLAMFAILALSSSCSNDQLPSDATLSISPSSRTFEITEQLDENDNCIYFDNYTLDTPLQISLQDGSGNPIGDMELSVYADWTENTFGGGRFPLALYRDMNGNGIIDEDLELVSGAEDDVATFRTSEFGGSATLLLRVNLSCSYRGQVFVFSDFVSAAVNIETTPLVVEEPEVEVEGEGEGEGEGEEAKFLATGGTLADEAQIGRQEPEWSVFGGSW